MERKKTGRIKVRGASGPDVKPKGVATKRSSHAGGLDFSRQSEAVAEIMARIEKLPEVREEKVQAIKEAIETGRYAVDPAKVAAKILSEL